MKTLGLALLAAFICIACDEPRHDTDSVQRDQQEQILKEGMAQTGLPAIKNFREKKLLKDVLELRDQDGISTWTYTFAENNGILKLLCESIGYGIPYATQYTNPAKLDWQCYSSGCASGQLPQADPNGLFSPASAEGTWVVCKAPDGKKTAPVYIEPRIIVSPFPLQ